MFRRHGPAWRAAKEGHLSVAQRRVMTAIEICRTEALGGHVERCEDCAHTRVAYNSCRNRHCPKCQWSAAERWMEARKAELLPVPYHHVVFTLPAALAAIAFQNKAKVYGLLLQAAAEALTTIASDPKHLGAEMGLTAVLHTWGQNLDHHPHVHCIVPGGGLSADRARSARPIRTCSNRVRAEIQDCQKLRGLVSGICYAHFFWGKKMLQKIIDALAAHGQNIGPHDVAAGVNESILNAYSVAHHTDEYPKPNNNYKGSGDLPDLRLGYAFDIAKPIVFNLSPNPTFNEEMGRWMTQHGAPSQPGLAENMQALLGTPQPNLKVIVPDIVLTFTLETISKKIQVSFSLTVLCYVTTDSADQIRIVPISAVVDDPKALEQAVNDAARKVGIPLGKQDVTCFELWELVKYIINNTLADHVSQFIETIPIPSFIKVIEGVNLGNVTVVIIEKFIVATAMASARMPKLLESEAIPTEGIKEHAEMMQNVAEAAFTKASGSASVMAMQTPTVATLLPGQGFFLLLTQALFQKLADKYVNINQGSESCSTFLGLIQGCAGWDVRVWNPRVTLQAPNLLVDCDFSADGYVKARAHLPWPIGWTGWATAGVKGTADPRARLTTSFYAKGGNTVWMSAGARPFWINWVPTGNVGWPLGLIVAALLDIFTNVTLFIISLIGARWNIKLAGIPSNIPGTGVTATPSIDSTMTNYSGDLAITGTVTFH